MKIKIIYDAPYGLTWALRLINEGDCYGLNDCIVHNEARPLVEFFDTRYPHTDIGQFVSRYYVETLLGGKDGLLLDGGIPEWRVSASGMDAVRAWLEVQR